jgi:hypothetical protein
MGKKNYKICESGVKAKINLEITNTIMYKSSASFKITRI